MNPSLPFKLFILKARWKTEISHPLVTPQIPTIARAGPVPRQDQRTQSRSPIQAAEVQVHDLHPVPDPRCLSGRHPRHPDWDASVTISAWPAMPNAHHSIFPSLQSCDNFVLVQLSFGIGMLLTFPNVHLLFRFLGHELANAVLTYFQKLTRDFGQDLAHWKSH